MDLPEGVERLPLHSAPLLVAPYGYRSYDFVPFARDAAMEDEHALVATYADRDGRRVDLFERDGTPAQWYLRWRLQLGHLYTHLRQEEGPDRASRYVASLGIAERADAAPSLLPEPPLSRGVVARPGYEEYAVFLPEGDAAWEVKVQRPGYVPNGKVMRDPMADHTTLRAGAADGLEVSVRGEGAVEDGRELVERVVASLRQAGSTSP